MTGASHRLLFWTPRILAVLFAGFLGLFATDVFSETHGFLPTAAAFLIHLIPAALVLFALLVAWRNEVLGGALYLVLGGTYLVSGWGRFHWSAFAVIAGPLFLVALLFLAHAWLARRTAQRTA